MAFSAEEETSNRHVVAQADEIVPGHRKVVKIKGREIGVFNLDGGYHVPHMHPALSDQLDINSYQSTLGAGWSVQSCGGKTDKRVGSHADYLWIYPGFMINRYGPWMDTNQVIPLTTDSCRTVFDYYFEGTPSAEETSAALAASEQVQQEDIEICRRVQTGLGSGAYDQGVYAPRFEAPMFHFHQQLAADLTQR